MRARPITTIQHSTTLETCPWPNSKTIVQYSTVSFSTTVHSCTVLTKLKPRLGLHYGNSNSFWHTEGDLPYIDLNPDFGCPPFFVLLGILFDSMGKSGISLSMLWLVKNVQTTWWSWESVHSTQMASVICICQHTLWPGNDFAIVFVISVQFIGLYLNMYQIRERNYLNFSKSYAVEQYNNILLKRMDCRSDYLVKKLFIVSI